MPAVGGRRPFYGAVRGLSAKSMCRGHDIVHKQNEPYMCTCTYRGCITERFIIVSACWGLRWRHINKFVFISVNSWWRFGPIRIGARSQTSVRRLYEKSMLRHIWRTSLMYIYLILSTEDKSVGKTSTRVSIACGCAGLMATPSWFERLPCRESSRGGRSSDGARPIHVCERCQK